MRILKSELESERSSIREDRIKLDLFKNELKTKQKTIENMRYEFIKNGHENIVYSRENARDIGLFKL